MEEAEVASCVFLSGSTLNLSDICLLSMQRIVAGERCQDSKLKPVKSRSLRPPCRLARKNYSYALVQDENAAGSVKASTMREKKVRQQLCGSDVGLFYIYCWLDPLFTGRGEYSLFSSRARL